MIQFALTTIFSSRRCTGDLLIRIVWVKKKGKNSNLFKTA